MRSLIILLSLAGICLASGYGYGYYNSQKSCYMCEYRPERTWTHKVPVTEEFTFKVSKVVKECTTKVVYEVEKGTRTKLEMKTTTKPAEGQIECKGPLEPEWAIKAGIKTEKCESSCFLSVDRYRNILRGCHTVNDGGDPYNGAPQKVGDSIFRFCRGQLCNEWKVY